MHNKCTLAYQTSDWVVYFGQLELFISSEKHLLLKLAVILCSDLATLFPGEKVFGGRG
jgi:hypothetical protein